MAATNPLAEAQLGLTGFSRTEDERVTTTILGEVGGVRVYLRQITTASPTGGTIEFCQRCWTDIDTGITTCVPITCPKTQTPLPTPDKPIKT
jgi:hypothetical protein